MVIVTWLMDDGLDHNFFFLLRRTPVMASVRPPLLVNIVADLSRKPVVYYYYHYNCSYLSRPTISPLPQSTPPPLYSRQFVLPTNTKRHATATPPPPPHESGLIIIVRRIGPVDRVAFVRTVGRYHLRFRRRQRASFLIAYPKNVFGFIFRRGK